MIRACGEGGSLSLRRTVLGLTYWALMPISRIYLPTVRSAMTSPRLRSLIVIFGAPQFRLDLSQISRIRLPAERISTEKMTFHPVIPNRTLFMCRNVHSSSFVSCALPGGML